MTTHQFHPFNILFSFALPFGNQCCAQFPSLSLQRISNISMGSPSVNSLWPLALLQAGVTGQWHLQRCPVASPVLLHPMVTAVAGLHTHPVLCLFLYPFPTPLPWCPLPPLSGHTHTQSPAQCCSTGCGAAFWSGKDMRGVIESLLQCDCECKSARPPLSPKWTLMHTEVPAPLLCPSSSRAHDNRWNSPRKHFLASQPTLDLKEIFISFTEHYHGTTSSAKCLNLNLETSLERLIADQGTLCNHSWILQW